jgi:hypothetical protein
VHQANNYFNNGRYLIAASCYAQTNLPLSRVSLKFMEKKETDALKTYLLNKLDTQPRNNKVQISMLSIWLVEIYLQLLKDNEDENSALAEEFHTFLCSQQVLPFLDPKTVYTMMLKYCRYADYVFFCKVLKDDERLLVYYLNHKLFAEALSILETTQHSELVYQYSNELMQIFPEKVVSLWVNRNDLEPKNLISTMFKFKGDPKVCIAFLEHCVNVVHYEDQILVNVLIGFYAQTKQESKLIKFMQQRGYNFDLYYAIRICHHHSCHLACVLLYGAMKMYEEAVDLALQNSDLDLAKLYAAAPEDSSQKKRLWLKIIQHVIDRSKTQDSDVSLHLRE